MTAPAVVPQRRTSPLHPRLAQLDAASCPQPEACARWAHRAGLVLERCLADHDARLLEGVTAATSAHAVLDEWMGWVRQSVGALASAGRRGSADEDTRRSFSLAWRLAADAAAEDDDPAALEGFCRSYLAAVEALARGGHAGFVASAP